MSSTKPAAPATRTDTTTDTTTEVEGYGSQESLDQGYFGTVPDETPNEHYTFAGQIAGKPTPESPQAEALPKAGERAAP